MIAFPCFEFPRPLCSCGRELSTDYYFLAAKTSFEDFARNVGHQELVKAMGFEDDIEKKLKEISGGKICCLMTLRFGTTQSISVNKAESSNRVYPSSLPLPTNQVKGLFWLDTEIFA